MKKVTFPHMGNMDIPVSAFFEELGFEVVIPPKISRRTLDLGVKYGPEFACLPLKIILGNFIEAMEIGANIIVMGGGCGPCRFGYYAEVQREILQDLGYSFEIFVIEPDLLMNYKNIKSVFGSIPYRRLYSAAKLAWIKACAVDEVHSLVLKRRATENKTGIVDNLYRDFLKEIKVLMSVEKIKGIKKIYKDSINDTIDKSKHDDLQVRIGIVGEIYLVLEPYVNLDLEEKLGKLGVIVEKELYMTSWLKHFLHFSSEAKLVEKAATKYLKSFVGGHGLDSIGNTVLYSQKGFDGVIQLAPFTCMPEIVSQSILPSVSENEDIPVLSLFFDEHSADAGLQTRLEAFVDLLIRKKEQKESVLYG
ncbi:MAG: acyl-CoA dehydratase activase-related protein [Halanaerobiaceae bacterium]